jgi:hypothetical protein
MTRMGRMVLAVAVPAMLSGAASAQTPHIDFAEVISFGYAGAGTEIAQGPIRRHITHTPVRAVAVGTTFNMKVRIMGKPDGADVALRFVFRAPRPGMKDPKTGALRREDAEEMKAKIGGEIARTFEFKEQWQIVRGTWRAEVWNGQRRIAMRRFAVQ